MERSCTAIAAGTFALLALTPAYSAIGVSGTGTQVLGPISSFDYQNTVTGTPPAQPPFNALSSDLTSPGVGVFYQPYVFLHNVLCVTAACGERNTMNVLLNVSNGQVNQFYNASLPAAYLYSGGGNMSASNPYTLICNPNGVGPCAGAPGGIGIITEVVGEEINTDVRITGVVRKVGLQIVSTSTDIGVASTEQLDGAVLIANQGGGVGFRNGIMFGQSSSFYGIYGSFLYAPSGHDPQYYVKFPNMTVTGAGAMTLSGSLTAVNIATGAGNNFQWTGRSLIWSAADGTILLTNNANNDFSRLQLGGLTSAYPSIKHNGAALNFRLADDSADAAITAAAIAASGTVTLSPPTTSNAILIKENTTNHAGVIAFNNSISTANADITSVDGALTVEAGGYGITFLNTNFMIPNTNNAATLGAASNFWKATYSDAVVVGGTAPTSSGTCAVTSQAGGNTAGTFVASGSCAGGTYILTFAVTAPTGWACQASDRTTTTNTVRQRTTGSTTTAAAFLATTTSGDVISFSCTAY